MSPVPKQLSESRALPRPVALEWFLLALGLALVVRYRWLFDDSFVYFRYVDNLLFLDAGLTYNAGEFVEGFSSPAHCLLLVVLRALHLGFPTIVLLIGLVGFTAFWYLLVVLNRSLSPDRSALTLNFPLAYLAANYSVSSFFTAGNEGALLHVSAAATALYLLRPRSRLLASIVAIVPLVRPELALAGLLTGLCVWWSTGRAPRFLLAVAALANGGWLLFRIHYYADLLPNTFYLKTGTRLESGTHLEAGLRYLLNTTGPYHALPVLGVFGLLAWRLARRRSGADTAPRRGIPPRAAMLLIAASVATWTIASGGSSMHYYYLAFPFTLTVCALGGLLERALFEYRPAARPGQAWLVMLPVTAAVFSCYPPLLSRHPVTLGEEFAQLPDLELMNDPSFFRNQEPFEGPWPEIEDMLALAPTLRAQGYGEWTDFTWCNTIYAHPEVRAIHGLGLTDAFLARVDTPEATRGHKPALPALAVDLIEIQMAATEIGRGVYSSAIDSGSAPAWMAANRDTIELLERKVFNRHNLAENMRLALRFPPKIQL
ncbi:MAG: hypothetical protein ACI8QZ_003507 [Chlamydiales bacterium]|jgi:hypothetical protein